jgi:DNA mismatch repair protein MutL
MVHEPLADYDVPSNRAKAGGAYNENVPKPLALPLMAQPAENLAPGMSPSTPLRAQPAQPYRQDDPAPGCNPPVRQRFAELTVLGQFQGTYIICQSEAAELIVIDQHAAHERIVYERLSRSNGHIEAQRLLLPATVELGFAEARALEPLLPSLNGLGLEIEPFGGSTWVVKTMPVVLDPNYAEHLVRELAEKALESGETLGLERILDQCRMVMACHRAVRAHQTLDPREIRSLLAELDQCAQPSHCPHGRPTWIRWTLRELEKMFGRTA